MYEVWNFGNQYNFVVNGLNYGIPYNTCIVVDKETAKEFKKFPRLSIEKIKTPKLEKGETR